MCVCLDAYSVPNTKNAVCVYYKSQSVNDVSKDNHTLLLNRTKPISKPSIFSTMTELQARWSKVQIPVGATDFPHLQNDETSSGVHPASYSTDTGISS